MAKGDSRGKGEKLVMTNRQAPPYLKTDVSQETKDLFAAKARELDKSERGLLRLLVETFLGQNPVAEEVPAPTGIKDDFFGMRLGGSLKKELQNRAKEHHMKAGPYVEGLLRSHLSKKPFFTEIEMEVLRQSNNELTAIGRNINQIARALNASLDNAHLLKASEIKELAEQVKNNRNAVRSLMKANLAAWGVEHGTETD